MAFFSRKQSQQRTQVGQPTDSNLIPEEYRARHEAFRRLSSRLSLLVALLVMAASVVAYGGVLFYVTGLRTELSDIEASIRAIAVNRDEEEERRIIALDRQLRSANQLIENHRHLSALFNHIEALTHPLARFSSANIQYEPAGQKVDFGIDIIGPSYRVLAEQLASFESSPFITSVNVTEFSLQESGMLVGRGLITFDPAVLEAEEGFYAQPEGSSSGVDAVQLTPIDEPSSQ